MYPPLHHCVTRKAACRALWPNPDPCSHPHNAVSLNVNRAVSMGTCTNFKMSNSHYRKYAIWPRDGTCHANHACAALTVSRSCRQAFVFFHWKCTQVLQKSLSSSIKQTCFKRYHHDLLRHLVAFSKFEWFTVYAIYFASLIFRESGLQDISVSG